MEIEPKGLNFSSAKHHSNLRGFFFLFLLSFFSPNVVPLSTSKPQKPMNTSNPKQLKPTLQCVLLLHWSGGEKPHVRSDFHHLKLSSPRFGQNRRLGCWVFAILLLSSIGAAARNHVWSNFHLISFRRLGLVRISANRHLGCWVFALFLSSSLFISASLASLYLYAIKSSP